MEIAPKLCQKTPNLVGKCNNRSKLGTEIKLHDIYNKQKRQKVRGQGVRGRKQKRPLMSKVQVAILESFGKKVDGDERKVEDLHL